MKASAPFEHAGVTYRVVDNGCYFAVELEDGRECFTADIAKDGEPVAPFEDLIFRAKYDSASKQLGWRP